VPEAEEKTIAFLVDCVIASKKHLASIDHGVKAARHEARKAGHDKVTHRDAMVGFNNTVLPSDRNLVNATEAAKPASTSPPQRGAARSMQRHCSRYATRFPRPVRNGIPT